MSNYLKEYLEIKINNEGLDDADKFEELVASRKGLSDNPQRFWPFYAGLLEGMLDNLIQELPFDENELIAIVESYNKEPKIKD